MKRACSVALALTVLALVSVPSVSALDAVGSGLGCMTTGKTLEAGSGDLSGALGIADATSFVGGFTFGLADYIDGRVRLGLVDGDGVDAALAFGLDFKYQMMVVGVDSKAPFDMSLGGFLEYIDTDYASALQVGGQAIGSYPFQLKGGAVLSPYTRLNVRLENVSGNNGGDTETSLKIGFNAGVEWQITDEIDLLGEFQLDGNDGVFFGVNFGVI